HVERLVRPLLIEFADESIEAGLLLKDVFAGWSGRLFFQRQVHALMPAVLLGTARPDALQRDPEPQPPHRQLRQIVEPVWTGERQAVVAADRRRQATFDKQPAERVEDSPFSR